MRCLLYWDSKSCILIWFSLHFFFVNGKSSCHRSITNSGFSNLPTYWNSDSYPSTCRAKINIKIYLISKSIGDFFLKMVLAMQNCWSKLNVSTPYKDIRLNELVKLSSKFYQVCYRYSKHRKIKIKELIINKTNIIKQNY